MKTMFALLLVIAALSGSAQTNFDVLVCKDASYTNATIMRATPAYLVVSHNEGIAKVALTNLPLSLQQRYHYDPTNAAAMIAAEEKHRLDVIKAKAEQAKYLASLRGTNQLIWVVAVLDEFGQCTISSANGGGGGFIGNQRVYITGLPESVSGFLVQQARLKANIASLAAQPVIVTATTRGSDDDAFNSQLAAQNALYDARQAKAERLKQMKETLAEMNESQLEATTITAFPTGTKYSGLPMWQCVNQ